MTQRVVVTGLGIVCGLGFDWETFWNALVAGKSAICRWQMDSAVGFPVQYAAPVDDAAFAQEVADMPELRQPMERRSRFGLLAAHRALRDAGLAAQGSRIGVAVGSGVPERSAADMMLALGEDGPRWDRLYARRGERDPSLRNGNDHLAALIARRHGVLGPVMNFSTACAG
ncbi:MAG TPA: beta-ketoacyl synthase N-terminal-like domain-containing protein, partial [Noviherbaspirillum sp.]